VINETREHQQPHGSSSEEGVGSRQSQSAETDEKGDTVRNQSPPQSTKNDFTKEQLEAVQRSGMLLRVFVYENSIP